MQKKRRLRGYQHLSASGHLSSLLEGHQFLEQLSEGISETRRLFDFLDENIDLLNPQKTRTVSLKEWVSLKEVVVGYAQKHTDIERSQVLFVLTALRGIQELRKILRATTQTKIIEDAGEGTPLVHWFENSQTAEWIGHLVEMLLVGRRLRAESPFLREHLWAVSGRLLHHILLPFYRVGRHLDEHGWWEYFVRQGYATPLCHIRHPYDETHAEEWRTDLLNAILEEVE